MKNELLKLENSIALKITQAMLGILDGSIHQVSFTFTVNVIELQFVVSPSYDPKDDIDDIVFELDVLTDGKFFINSSIVRGTGEQDNRNARLVYKKKPAVEDKRARR